MPIFHSNGAFRADMWKFFFTMSLISSFIFISEVAASWTGIYQAPVQITTAKKISHNDRGLRRIVRIDGVTICLADGVGGEANHEGIYRSRDNGRHWDLIGGIKGSSRGTIISGPEKQVLIFWLIPEGKAPGIYFTKFGINQKPPAPRPIYQGYVKSVGYSGGYQDSSAAVDKAGMLYFVAHFPKKKGSVDGIWLLRSSDQGNTWDQPKQIAYEPGTSFAYPSLEVDHAGNLILCFAEHSPEYPGGREDDDKRIYYMKSYSKGASWGERVQVDHADGPFRVYNPCIVEDLKNDLYIFAQRAFQGLVMAKSKDFGATWSGFSIIIPTSNYADPSVAIGSDNTIYIIFRDDKICTNASEITYHATIAASKNGGRSWNIMYSYCEQGKVGPGLSMRYANWWNYGGPLEWCWEQYLKSDKSVKPVYYGINPDISIANRSHQVIEK